MLNKFTIWETQVHPCAQGIMPGVDCFQREMSHLFLDLDFVKVCLGDVLTHSNDNEEDHIKKNRNSNEKTSRS